MEIEIKKISKVFAWSNSKKIYISEEKLYIDDTEKPISEEDKAAGITFESIGHSECQKYYQEILKKLPISNLVILSGAGTSVRIGSSNNGNGGLTMAALWDALNESKLIDLHSDNKTFGAFCTACGYSEKYQDGEIIKDLEKLLDFANRKAYSDAAIKTQIVTIQRFIIKCCTLNIGTDESHRMFLRKITKKKIKDARIKLFTTNYDTLWEQAASKDRFTIIDGFTYSYPRMFNGRFFDFDIVVRERTRLKDEDSFIPKLFHLYKIHGSLGWHVLDNEIVQEQVNLSDNEKDIKDINLNNRLVIFPTNNKYESSYEPPYFEMMSRFQQALRKENTLLITIGFSFLDKHISNVIEETMKQNPSLNLVIVDPSINPNGHNWIKTFAFTRVDNRTIMLGQTFANFAKHFPDNESFDQLDHMSEFANKLTQLLNGKS